MSFALNGTAIKEPSLFKIEDYDLTKGGRVASGLMKIDLIARKRKFLFQYKVLSGTDLDTIHTAFETDLFVELRYVENGITKYATVYKGAIQATKFRTDGRWYWKDVKFDLIEQ